jgi:hypothetical protein
MQLSRHALHALITETGSEHGSEVELMLPACRRRILPNCRNLKKEERHGCHNDEPDLEAGFAAAARGLCDHELCRSDQPEVLGSLGASSAHRFQDWVNSDNGMLSPQNRGSFYGSAIDWANRGIA